MSEKENKELAEIYYALINTYGKKKADNLVKKFVRYITKQLKEEIILRG